MTVEKDYQEELDKYLGPEYISFRSTGYAEEAYIEGWVAVQMANRIFGYNGWSSEIKSFSIVDIEENIDKRYTALVNAHVRVTLSNGVYREDLGCGIVENIKGKSKALQKAHKIAVTDALKRALKQFGNALGSCCNDKQYINTVKRMKKTPANGFSESDIIRPQRCTSKHIQSKDSKDKAYARRKESTKRNMNNNKALKSEEESNLAVPNIEDIVSSDI